MFYSHPLHMFHIQQWCVQCWVPFVNRKYNVAVKKETPFSCKSYEEPASRRQKDRHGAEASARFVLLSMAGGDNGDERFGSLTRATFTSPQVDKVKMDGPN